MEIIANRLIETNHNLKKLLENRLSYFSNQGLESSLTYQAKSSILNDLNIAKVNLNRILFNTLAFLLESTHNNEKLKITVKNNSKSLMITFSFPQGRPKKRLPSLKNGFSLYSSRKKHTTSFLAVQSLVRESGGRLCLSSCNTSLCLQIPLAPHEHHEKHSPPKKRKHTNRFAFKDALIEGVFFNRYLVRLGGL